MKLKSVTVVLVLGVVVLIVVLLMSVETIPPDILTRSRMMRAEALIREYATVNGSLPDSLLVLPKPSGVREDNPVDGWGHPIHYSVRGQTVTLSSLGDDGQPGGEGQNADITVTFTVDTPAPGNNGPVEQPVRHNDEP